VEKAIQAALGGGLEYEKEYRAVLASGSVRWIAARGRVELGPQGRPVLMRGVLLDITAQKNSDTELQQLRGQLAHAGRVSMMGQLASALAHELNQPLGAILRNAEAAELFMQDAEPNLDEVRAIIADIRKDDQRAGDVIDRLRALLKRRDIETRALSVSALLEEVRALTRADAAARGVKLAIQCAPDLPEIRGDRVHLQQVLINLIINGMDALGESRRADARVIVSARRARPGFVEVAVMDNGHGIPTDRLANVFDPFFTTKPHGMGMGLPISRTIIQTHGGNITAENVEGGGAAFRFTLPEDGDRNAPSI
jgi:C4-dicarboxylate-specific signal transduction histidine kinase